MEVAITDKNNQDTNLRAAEVEPTSTLGSAKHNAAQSDAPRLEQGKLRKFHVHDGQGGRQRAPSPASSERVLFNESFYAKSFDDLPGDNEHPLIGFKRTGEGMKLRVYSHKVILIHIYSPPKTGLVYRNRSNHYTKFYRFGHGARSGGKRITAPALITQLSRKIKGHTVRCSRL